MLLAAVLLFTANMGSLSLLPLDDCFYARKGVEMLDRGSFFDVTWNGNPTFQNPPLHFWILAQSYRLFGENDIAARLPTVLMALGILICLYRIGRITVGEDAAVVGVGLLLLVNYFMKNSRRVMLDIPTTFWISLGMLLILESARRPRLGLALGIPLAAAGLTKSVLGLVPLLVLAILLVTAEGRRICRNPWLIGGALVGLLCALSWPLQQGLTHGWVGVRAHYLGEITGRSTQTLVLSDVLFEYPRLLLAEFQPVVIPGWIAAVLVLWRYRRRQLPWGRLFLATWAVLPVLVLSLSSARSARYVFSTLVPLALLTAALAVGWKPRIFKILCGRIVPVLLVVLAAMFWVEPRLLTRDQNAPFKAAALEIRELLPPGQDIPHWGDIDWRLSNPLLYYGHHAPWSTDDLERALGRSRELPRPVLITHRDRTKKVIELEPGARRLLELGDWVILELGISEGQEQAP